MNDLIKKLDQFDFHDLPVASIKVLADPKIELELDLLFFDEKKDDYQLHQLSFRKIIDLSMGEFLLMADSEIEINRFDYKYADVFEGEIVFLLGFGAPALKLRIICEEVEFHALS